MAQTRPVEEVTTDQAGPVPATDLDSPLLYLNRELTWLAFNRRVLAEAQDARTPVLERIKFFAITASNLDEFFMKRIGGLKQQVAAGFQELTVDGRTPAQQIAECHSEIRDFNAVRHELLRELLELLARHDVHITSYDALPAAERGVLREQYYKNIFPLVTPLAMSPAHPFPFISNLSLNLLVTVRYPNDPERGPEGARHQDDALPHVERCEHGRIYFFRNGGEEEWFIGSADAMKRNLESRVERSHAVLARWWVFIFLTPIGQSALLAA
jgi:polyphosphate kinase